ncbi:hypothetical protein COY95_03815 [Candidatus Woesearchaeota archaeon CG_4_10_14_0_8_um_filter_47_5]|nr:MAG: hypothetical protein COY95_03815 [Candidatus Woesearchaeota archaeon CG_4_10_14_0_8_um_filter_47_5]
MARRKDDKKNMNLIMTLFIAAIMILSVFGIITNQNSDENSNKYNGFTFKQKDNMWVTTVDKAEYRFVELPYQIEQLPAEAAAVDAVRNARAVAVSFEMGNVSAAELEQELAYVDYARLNLHAALGTLNKYVVMGVAAENTTYALPYVSCEQATEQMPVIFFMPVNSSAERSSKISYNNYCILIEPVTSFDSLSLSERLTMGVLGIIK